MAEVLALAEVTKTLAEVTTVLVGVTTTPVEVTTTLQEVTTPLAILPETITVQTVILLPVLALSLLRVQTAPLLPTAREILLTRVQVVMTCGAGGARDQVITSRIAGQQNAPTSRLHSRAR